MDPRFKLGWCKNEAEKQDVIEDISSFVDVDVDVDSPPKKKAKTFSIIKKRPPPRKSDEISMYIKEDLLDEDENPLKFWELNEKRWPCLAKQAKNYLSLPASSAPVERIFSYAGKILRPERANLKDTNFEIIMFLKCNEHLR